MSFAGPCLAAALGALLLVGATGAGAVTHRGRPHHASKRDRTVPGAGVPVFTRVLKVDSARYTGPGTTTLFTTKTLSVTVSAKADDLRHAAGVRDRPPVRDPLPGGDQSDDDDPADHRWGQRAGRRRPGYNPGPGASVRRTGRYAYRYAVTNRQVAPGMKTVCVMLYDSPGDPRYPGNPHNIPADHVWETAKAPIR